MIYCNPEAFSVATKKVRRYTYELGEPSHPAINNIRNRLWIHNELPECECGGFYYVRLTLKINHFNEYTCRYCKKSIYVNKAQYRYNWKTQQAERVK